MTGFLPLRRLAHRRLSTPSDHRFVRTMPTLPVAASELHLSVHHLPLAFVLGEEPRVVLVLDDRVLTRPLLDEDGQWRGGYRPIALRTHPFRLGATPAADPLDALEVPPDAGPLSADAGEPIADAAGRASPAVAALHRLLLGLSAGRRALCAALDRLIVADVVVPLASPPDLPLHTVDAGRLGALSPERLAALVRLDFLPVDLATATVFSQRLLAPGLLAEAQRPAAVAAGRRGDPHAILMGLDDPSFAIDPSELFSLADLEALHLEPAENREPEESPEPSRADP